VTEPVLTLVIAGRVVLFMVDTGAMVDSARNK